MKKIVLLVTGLILTTGLMAQSRIKIGYVNSQQILLQYSEAIKAQSDLDALAKKWQSKIDSMSKELQNKYAQFQQQGATMTPEKQKEMQQELVALDQKINDYRQKKFGQPDGEYFKKQEELLGPVKEKILKAIKAVAREEKMNFVFDKSGDVLLLYAEDKYDITYKVLDKLKRGKF